MTKVYVVEESSWNDDGRWPDITYAGTDESQARDKLAIGLKKDEEDDDYYRHETHMEVWENNRLIQVVSDQGTRDIPIDDESQSS